MPFISYREYARRKNLDLKAIQDRIKRGTITERAIDRTGKRPKIDPDIADADFAQRHSHKAQTGALMQKKKYTPLETSPPKPIDPIDEMFGPSPKSLLDKKLAPVPKPEVITKMIDGKEVPVTQVPYAGTDNFDRYRSAKAGSEEIKARLLELELAEMEGRLVDVNDMKKELQTICTAIRESVLNVPAKVSPELLSCTSIVEMETKLYKELNSALEGLARLLNARANT